MILFSLIVLLLTVTLFIIAKSARLLFKAALATILLIIAIFYNLINLQFLAELDAFNQFKAFGFITQILLNTNGFEILRILDPVRFNEHIMFFDRNLFLILFGQGLGSGVYDMEHLLEFVHFQSSAFSADEIRSGIFFNFHDIWIDVGFRFGLIFVFFIMYKLILKNILNRNYGAAIFFGLLLINTSFSTTGIILTSLIIRFFPKKLYFKN
jgi:hypothetical protein